MRKTLWIRLLLVLALGAGILSPGTFAGNARAEETAEAVLYDDALGDGVNDHSWAEHSLREEDVVRSGAFAIRLNPSRDGALYLYSERYFLTAEYNTLEFWIHGGDAGGQQLSVLFQAGGRTVAKVDLDHYLADETVPAGEWRKVQIYLPPLKMPNGLFDGVLIQDNSHGAQDDVFLDDIRLVYETEPVPNKPPRPVYEQITVYDDEVNDGFQAYAFGDHSWTETSTVHADTYAIRLDPSFDNSIYLYKERALDVAEYPTFEFWIHGGEQGGQPLELVVRAGGEDVRTVDLDDYLAEGVVRPGVWEKVTIPLDTLAIPNGVFDGVSIAGAGGEPAGALYLDDLAFIRKTYEQPELAGISFASEALTMYAGNAETPVLTAMYDNGYVERVTAGVDWSSDAPDVAEAEAGTVTAFAKGAATVTAEYEGFVATLEVTVIEVEAETIYDDALRDGYDDWSWAKRDLRSAAFVRSGERSIEFVPRWWQGVYFNGEDSHAVDEYYGFEFWIHGGETGGQRVRFVVQDMNSILGSVVLDDALPLGVRAGVWQKVTVRFEDMGISGGYLNALVFQAWDAGVQEPVYIDDVKLLRYKDRLESPKPPVTDVTVAVDADADRRPISPDIYGVNFEEIPPDDVSAFDGYPVVRWGGNSVTRYNWELNVQNHASDWFFMNLPKETTPGETLPHGSRSDRFIDDTLADGAKVLLQVPTIGWTPKDREVRSGFSVAAYGEQQMTECSYGGWWCNPDAGNGVRPDGSYIADNDPTDTSKPVGPEFVTRWIEHIESRVGERVNDFALDNEPMLWPYTHRDVHPEMTTYDEMWTMTEAYASAIKAADPDANIYGPVVWGWCAYFYSAADGCSPGEDYAAHGDKPFLEWYLEKVRAHEEETGVRLIDYLDIHYYPMEAGVAISADESKGVADRRLRSLKSLYDPEFRDSSSWIWEPVRLIPRMKELIERTAPGTKLAITEYNFGNGRGISSGLAQAEALAIFGREGVDLATRWGQPLAGTPLEDAFKLYLDYDGEGGRIEGESVRAVSSNVDAVGAYAVLGEDGTLYTLLFNKDTTPKRATISTDGASLTEGDVYRFDATDRLGFVESISLGATTIVELPPRSATLIVGKP